MKMKNKKLFILLMVTLSIIILGEAQTLFATVNCSPSGDLSSGVYTCASDSTTQNPTTVDVGKTVIISALGTITLSPGFTASAGSTCNIFTGTMDADNDGIPDSWEMAQFGNLNQTGSTDYDSDGLTDFWEYLMGTNPKVAETDIDLDNDGMPDWYELQKSSNLDQDQDDGNCSCD